MSFKPSKITGAIMAAFISVSAPTSLQARDVPEIPQSLYDRYGSDSNSDRDRSRSSDSNRCSKFENLSKGRILQEEFSNGQGRRTVTISPSDGGTIGFKIELGTRGHNLPEQSCGPISNIF